MAIANFETAANNYWESGTIPDNAQELLYLATWASGGTLPREVSRSKAPTLPDGFLGSLQSDVFDSLDPTVVDRSLREQGYYVWDRLVPTNVLDNLEAHLAVGPAIPRGDWTSTANMGTVPGPGAPTWWMELQEAIKSPQVQSLVVEKNLIDAVSRYLGTAPMITAIVMWSSFAWDRADSASAQLFHYDLDRSNFLKCFVYLTDVDDTNGPHVYVPGSQYEKPKELLDGTRLDDARVARHYPRDTWASITGKRGTMFLADTQGFHKGTRLLSGHRSILQFNFGSDRFGYEPFPPIASSSSCPNALRGVLASNPRFFSQIYTDLQVAG